MEETRPHIEKIHATPHKAVVAVSGAGTQAVAWLLGVAGASRTILEALVPYGRESMISFLGFEPEQSASAQTAKDMARAAYRKAKSQLEDDSPAVGLACAATIATDRPKRGEHRAYVSAWDQNSNTLYSLNLHKGLRDRAGEEEVVSRLLVHALMLLSGLKSNLDLGLTPGDELQIEQIVHPAPLAQLLSGEADWVVVRGGEMVVEGDAPGALLPGSFSPLHMGHRGLTEAAGKISGFEVGFELSVTNVDKPALEEAEILERLAQFTDDETAVLTRTETFFKKARLFPGRTFVVGWDTAIRLVAPRYYGDDPDAMMVALAAMLAAGTKFLVAGREDDGTFKTLADVEVPQGFEGLFKDVPEHLFREDISSTQLRAVKRD
jgi:nicotinamide mononucleotide (NMN) deamidase PncC|tara:strand:- start:654 stop:1790 length:1137 start_codon:yes stop_codon:yes gene_type:complete